ncbi:MAG: GNAT family N-acetyltransferase [Flavobacteriales bacterium]
MPEAGRNGLRWRALPFDALRPVELHDLLRLRVDIFVVEQRCAYAEIDGQDPSALHILGEDGGGALVAYARVLPPGQDGKPHIGRLVVEQHHRGTGIGRELMERAIRACTALHPALPIVVQAQAALQDFYRSLGFAPISGEYLWDGIPHVDMERPPVR